MEDVHTGGCILVKGLDEAFTLEMSSRGYTTDSKDWMKYRLENGEEKHIIRWSRADRKGTKS